MALKESDLYSSLWASCDELRVGMDTGNAALEAKLAKARQVMQCIMQGLLAGRPVSFSS